jgi:hypothetical protein
MSLVPTTVVIAMLPRAGTDSTFNQTTMRWSADPFAEEMQRRVAAGCLADWQWRWALERTAVFRTRRAWPGGTEARVGIWPPLWLSDAEISATIDFGGAHIRRESGLSWDGTFEHYKLAEERNQRVGVLEPNTRGWQLAVRIDGGRSFGSIMCGKAVAYSWKGSISLPTRAVGSPDEAIKPVKRTELDTVVLHAVEINVSTFNSVENPTHERYVSLHADRSKWPELRGIAFGPVVDLLHDGQLVRTIKFDEATPTGFGRDQSMRWIAEIKEFDTSCFRSEDVGHWTLRLRGDPAESLREFDCDEYWTGEIEYPLSTILTR